MRTLTFEELDIVSGGDDGGCGSGGDCGGTGGDGGGTGGEGTPSACVVGDGVITCGESISADGIATITITGQGFGQGLTASQAAQFGGLIGGATGLAAFVA